MLQLQRTIGASNRQRAYPEDELLETIQVVGQVGALRVREAGPCEGPQPLHELRDAGEGALAAHARLHHQPRTLRSLSAHRLRRRPGALQRPVQGFLLSTSS